MTNRQILEATLSLLLQVAFVVGVSALVSRRLRSSAARDRLWSACLAVLAILPAADFVLPHLRLIPASLPAPGDDGSSVVERSLLLRALLLLWAAGSAVLFLRLTRDFVGLARLFRTATAAPDSFLTEIRAQLSADGSQSGGSDADPLVVAGRPVGILFSDALRSPSCWQLQRPLIVLPASVRFFSVEETALIVRHELAHLRFRHPLLLFVQRLVEVVLWVHPAAWWAARQAGRTREFRCDEEAVASRSSAATYLRAILRLALPDECDGATPAGALGFGAECPLIVDRAERLASRDWTSPAPAEGAWRSAAPVVCAVAAMLLLWVPIGAAASRRSHWSPWPAWSASVLHSLGVAARDYEIDGHRLRPEEFHRVRPE